jgi:beta-1,4-mannosyl-glycoprotein beta-1,4-N-acetylglucosaminyltransferase
MYSGEEEILDLRLNILTEHVDLFVIGEAELTFSGKAKPLYFEQNAAKFKPFLHKIRYWVVENYYDPKILKYMQQQYDLANTAYPFLMAFYQKESLQLAFDDAKDTDTIYYGDCDEIWTPQELQEEPYKLEQLSYSMYLNNRTTEPWKGTAIASYATVKDYGLNQIRQKTTNYHPNGGWHFSNQGGLEQIRRKLKSYDHQEVNTVDTHAMLEERYRAGTDFLGRNIQNWQEESHWPPYLTENRDKYSNLLWKN